MQHLRGPLAAVMCLSLLSPPTPVWAAPPDTHPIRPQSEQMQGDQRILHALSRLTFGPRLGDLESVRSLGLDRWFDQQLHPASLDQSDLRARLSQFPAMQWSSEDLLFRLPSNAIIRQVIDGKATLPQADPLLAVYQNQVARVQAKRQEKEQKQLAGPSETAPAAPSVQMNSMAPSASVAEPPFDPALADKIMALPPSQRIARLASLPQPQFDSFFKSLRGPKKVALTADMSPAQRESVGALENPQRLVIDELMAQRLTHDIYSSTQLQEVMTDFWLNHFNVFLHKNEATPYYLVSYERDVLRPRALGKFEDLLDATAHSPAMLIYLDNASSTGPDSPAAEKAKSNALRQPAAKRKAPEGLNENYARELMELHTLGVNGGYSQADVIQAARILTGWTVDRPQRGGGFKFDPNRHEPGAKKVLGKKFKESGEREGRELLHFLATRPATAQFLSRKLAIRFVSDDPPRSLTDRMAKSYLKSGGDISAVLTTMFHSPEFWSPSVYRAKIKTPLEYVLSAARASNANFTNLQPLANALREMGMPLYGAVPPTGYKWDAADWVSTGALVNRMNFALSLASNRLPGISTAWSPEDLTTPPDTNPQPEESRLETMLIAGGVSDSTRSAVLQQFQQQMTQPTATNQPVSVNADRTRRGAAASAKERQDQLLAGLLLGSPEFQRR